ncbi:slipin family protein [Streptomyces somaliensis]|uniref:slipin family protein n=1 Tax=Streptomyces somaliensis TaxID=78355 RepID=UPI0020CE26C5|nr:slipin family protein [Streptomyces somaliensis]MCP9944407.1 slipin family protein [Streptomyces somaliensis]MCP9962359.1 slipin family protein [Streptomyces somaliensis]MCP9975178.1 slipin family protein [Streptomyces somaliensis]
MGEELLTAVVLAGSAALAYTGAALRVVKQYEQGVVLRFGRLRNRVRGPGLTLIVPLADRLRKVNMQIVTMPVPAQDGITRDNVTVRVDAVIYFRVVDPVEAVIRVEDYRFAVSQIAQTSLRSIIGKSDLDDLLSNREKLNEGLELMIDNPAVEWGVTIDRVEIKDVSLPETMKRSMARQAEADRERRARLINADAELQASRKLSEAAREMADTPSALQLRLLQTVMAVAAERNSTLVLPIPVELLRFLERSAEAAERRPGSPGEPERPGTQPAGRHPGRPAGRPGLAAAPEDPAPAARRDSPRPAASPPPRAPAPAVPPGDGDAGTAGCL